nr:hypothetical protein [Serratia marcescens]
IVLPVQIGDVAPCQRTVDVAFTIIDCPSTYNIILWCPTLRALQVVASTFHLVIKFPTPSGMSECRGDQVMARTCYFLGVQGQEFTQQGVLTHKELSPERKKSRPEPSGDLMKVPLDEAFPSRCVQIGSALPAELRERVLAVLREYSDVFAWGPSDMPGISRELISHKLSIPEGTRPIKQKLRPVKMEKHVAICEEVEKLLHAGFIRPVDYPEWLANVVMVKKNSGKWRMCVDFTDLNAPARKIVTLSPTSTSWWTPRPDTRSSASWTRTPDTTRSKWRPKTKRRRRLSWRTEPTATE